MALNVNGTPMATDDDGYLVNMGDWSEAVADAIAHNENVQLTPAHWEIIHFLRDYYNEFQIAPAIRVMSKAVGRKLGPEKGTVDYLDGLFPGGAAKQGCKLAGLPKPTGCT